MNAIKIDSRCNLDKFRRVLIFRVGSLGDTLVALPALRLVANAYPNAERRLLTYVSRDQRAITAKPLLEGTGLVHGYHDYSNDTKTIKGLLKLCKEIRRWKPDVLVYLMEPKGLSRTFRDAAYFRWACGISKIIGLPVALDRRKLQMADNSGRLEREAARLARCLSALGRIEINSPASHRLSLTVVEQNVANRIVHSRPSNRPIIAASIGTKFDVNDWGNAKWGELVRKLYALYPDHMLIMFGASVERERSERVLESWDGASKNLCGELNPRESAAVIEKAKIFIGHDSGPLHLAASVGTRCVGIFSARNPPGEWFPLGEGHKVLYHQVPCYGCKLSICSKHNKICILSIEVAEVIDAVRRIIDNT